jgi:hypothetical protein
MTDEKLLERVKQIHPSVDDFRENCFGIEGLVFDENSGAAATVCRKQWFNKFGPGGTGMAKVVTIFHPDKTIEERGYIWRDQYDPSKDNDWNYIRSIQLNPESNESELILDAETPVGNRTLRYQLRRNN